MSLINLYAKFSKLTTTDFRVGTVVSVGTETSLLTDPNGYSFTAIGTSVSAGNNAYVRDGIIQGQAPSLPISETLV